MSTEATFQDMLNQYLPNELLAEEMVKRDFFLQNCEKDNSWLGGPLIVPFEGAPETTFQLGSLAPIADINQATLVRGQVNNQPEIWGSMIFNEKDLIQHESVNAQSLLKILPNRVDTFIRRMKQIVSQQFTVGAALDSAAGNGNSSGEIQVKRPERFEVNMPLVIDDSDSAPLKVWVKTVNMETDVVTFCTDIGLTTLADLSGYTTAQSTVFYLPGGETAGNRLTSLKTSLLSASNGGSSSLYGVSKLAYPYTQAINIAGSAFTASNFLEQSLNAMIQVRNKGRGMADTIVLSFNNMGLVLKYLEIEKGPYRMSSDPKASMYGWQEVEIVGPKGRARFVAIQEMDDDFMMILDMAAMKIYSNGFFRKRKSPDGLEYYQIRNTNGYQYVIDIAFYGDMILEHPSRCGIVYGLSINYDA